MHRQLAALLPRRAKSDRSAQAAEAAVSPDERCAICQQTLCEPITFGCGLSACELCAAGWAEARLAGGDAETRGGLACPLGCGARHELKLPRVSVRMRRQLQESLGEDVYGALRRVRYTERGGEATALRARAALDARLARQESRGGDAERLQTMVGRRAL